MEADPHSTKLDNKNKGIEEVQSHEDTDIVEIYKESKDNKQKVTGYGPFATDGDDDDKEKVQVKPANDLTDIQIIQSFSDYTTMVDIKSICSNQKIRIMKYIITKLDIRANRKGENSSSVDEKLLELAHDMKYF